jgi:hypothetical protein
MEKIEAKQISETEFMVGNNRTSIIEGNIIYVIVNGEQTTELAILQKEVNLKLANLINGQISYLIDLNKAGKNSPDARNIWIEISNLEITKKVANFGIHPVARVLAAFVVRVSGKQNVRFFKTEEEALTWLLLK